MPTLTPPREPPSPAPQPAVTTSLSEDESLAAAAAAWVASEYEEPAPSAARNPQAASSTEASTAPSETSTLQTAVVRALLNVKGQTSAAEQLEDATWTLQGSTLEIQTTLSKTMLPVLINAEADKILKATLRDQGFAQLQVKLLPGATSNGTAAAKKPRVAAVGSAAELAEKHPLVQEAKRLFAADISNVIDLRKD